MEKNRKTGKELEFYCNQIEQTNPTELIKRLKKWYFFVGDVELFDKQFRGQEVATGRDWYPAMPCENGVKYFLNPTLSFLEKEERVSCYEFLRWSLKNFLEERNVLISLNGAFYVMTEYEKEIRNKCGKVAFFFIDGRGSICRALLVAKPKRWTINLDQIGIVDCVWYDCTKSEIYLLTNNNISDLTNLLL